MNCSINDAYRELRAADYLYRVTLPLVNEPKLLLSVLNKIFNSVKLAVMAFVDSEIEHKFVEFVNGDFEEKYNVFKFKLVNFYKIDKKYVTFIETLKEYVQEHKNSPVEFTKNDSFIICDNNYKVLVVTKKQILDFLYESKRFINIIDTCIGGRDVFHR